MKQIKCAQILAITFLSTLSPSFIWAQSEKNTSSAQKEQILVLKEGAWSGKMFTNDKRYSNADIIIEKLPSRRGSYFAIIKKGRGKKDQVANLYLVDKLQDQLYTMTMLEITDDGEIGIRNDDPSLVIAVTKNSLEVSSAKSGNNRGVFGGHMIFNKASRFSWGRIEVGKYGKFQGGAALNITSLGHGQARAHFVNKVSGVQGRYIIQELLPKMYTLSAIKITREGTEISFPSRVGVFISYKNKKTAFYLINPGNEQDTRKLSKR